MAKMPLLTLKSILASQKADALAAMTAADLSQERADAMDYYLGNMAKDMPVQEGRSKAVSTDVADTIEGLMPSLMDIFCGSDEVVRFEPVGPEDEEAAQQETDYVNHVFMQQNPGFMVLYSFIKDALLSKVGIVKVFWEEYEEEERETYFDQSDDAFAMIAQAALSDDSGLEIIEHTAKTDEATGAVTHDVTVQTTRKVAKACVMGVPPEEFGIERAARTIKDCNYCFHEVVTKTEADLIAEGYDPEQIKALSDYTGNTDTETQSRDTVSEHLAEDGAHKGSRLVKITEHYARIDIEGDAKPCLYKIETGGDQGEILKKDDKECIERFDMIPFAATCPVPVTHRFFGRSIADLVMDIQRIKTALVRGKLDNIYLHNNPRVEVAETHAHASTLDDLLVSRPGGIVRTKTPGGLNWQVVPDITGSIYPALEYWDSTREMRTGITRQSQGVDANALQNQSATAVNQAFSASQARMKLIARIIAEGVRDMFSLLHATIRKHGQEAQTVRLRNSWVQVDPRQWKTRNDMTINVGLGTGGKAERVAHVMALGNFQKELVLGGKSNLVDDAKLYNTFKELAKLMDYKNPDQFINDPMKKDPQTGQPMYPPPPPQPDPKIVELQAKNEIEKTQAQADIATQQVKTEAEIALNEKKAQTERELAILEFQLQNARDEREHELKMAQLNAKLAADRETHAMRMSEARETHEQNLESGAFKAVAAQETHKQKLEQTKAKPDGK